MVFPILGNHSFRALVGDPNCPSLINYGQIVNKKKLDLQLEASYMALNMKKAKPLQHMLEEEKVSEGRFKAEKIKVEDQLQLRKRRRRRIYTNSVLQMSEASSICQTMSRTEEEKAPCLNY